MTTMDEKRELPPGLYYRGRALWVRFMVHGQKEQREPVPQCERYELVLDAPVEQVVRRLLTHVARPAAFVARG